MSLMSDNSDDREVENLKEIKTRMMFVAQKVSRKILLTILFRSAQIFCGWKNV